MTPRHCLVLMLLAVSAVAVYGADSNLTCYQCQRNKNEECGPESLKPCPSNKDRCVTHITNSAKNGYLLKRECGLGPCGFEDDMVNRGLGLGPECDQSKEEYFCVSCCKQSGCNKSSGSPLSPVHWIITCLALAVASINAGTL